MVELIHYRIKRIGMENKDLQNRCNKHNSLSSADGVQKANPVIPVLPMGTAAIAYTVWTRHLKINPANPEWPKPRSVHPFRRAWFNALVQFAAPDGFRPFFG